MSAFKVGDRVMLKPDSPWKTWRGLVGSVQELRVGDYRLLITWPDGQYEHRGFPMREEEVIHLCTALLALYGINKRTKPRY